MAELAFTVVNAIGVDFTWVSINGVKVKGMAVPVTKVIVIVVIVSSISATKAIGIAVILASMNVVSVTGSLLLGQCHHIAVAGVKFM